MVKDWDLIKLRFQFFFICNTLIVFIILTFNIFNFKLTM